MMFRLNSPLKGTITEIKENINLKKSPGFDFIFEQVLRQVPRKVIRKLSHLINASLRPNTSDVEGSKSQDL